MIRFAVQPLRDPPGPAANGRARRVAALLAVVVGLSLLDLVLTIGHMQTVGMFEMNPIALCVVRLFGSAAGLGVYKTLTVLVCVALLYRLRRFPQAEVGAWLAVGVLAFVSAAWVRYVDAAADLRVLTTGTQAILDPHWVGPETTG